MTGKASRRSDAGFTLVEMLVATIVISLMAMMLYQGFQLGGRLWSALSAKAAAMDDVGVAHRMIRNLLDQAYPLPAPTAQGFRVDFEGGPQAIRFWTPPPDIWAWPGGVIHGRLEIIEEAGRRDLVLTLSEERLSERISLLTDIAGAEFSYFSSATPVGWSRNWADRSTLPDLVRVGVLFRDGDRRRWPDLVVAPKVRMDTECVPDPLTQRCRGR